MLMARSAAARTMSLAMLTMSAAPLKFHDVPRDGNCLFSAVALSAALSDGATKPQSADALRAQAMDVLCSSGDVSLGGLPANLIIEPLGGEGEVGYCRRMRRSGEWGSTAELLALTRVLSRPIRVHTAFGAELYGADEGTASPLAVHYENSHYRAVTEAPASESAPPASSTCAAARLDAGEEAAVAAVAAVLDTLHAAASRADARTYFGCFEEDAVFMGTDPHERWSLAQFRAYATARFEQGDGWTYKVDERHIRIHGDVAWFDERLNNVKLGACRGGGVVLRAKDGSWRIAHYNLAMAIPNEAALAVAALVASDTGSRDADGGGGGDASEVGS